MEKDDLVGLRDWDQEKVKGVKYLRGDHRTSTWGIADQAVFENMVGASCFSKPRAANKSGR